MKSIKRFFSESPYLRWLHAPLLLGCFLIFFSPPVESKIRLSPGQIHKIPLEQDSDIHVSNGKVIRVTDTGTELIITALKPGHSAISSGVHSWLIEVLSHKKLQQQALLQKTLRPLMGLQPRFSGPLPTIHGTLYRLSDLSYLKQKLRELKYQFHIQVPLDLRNNVRDYLQKVIREHSLPNPQIKFHPNLSLWFHHISSEQQEEIQETLSPYGIPLSFSESGLDIQPLIEITVLIAEVNRSLQKQLGIQWGEGYKARLLPIFSHELEVAIQALESKGQGQILASPKLLCRSGSKAEFLAGGEFPIKIFNYQTQSIVWKSHGVHLSILPKADHKNQISVDLSTEISIVDNAQSVDGVPGLKTNRLQTHFDLKKSQTIALSGLIRHDFGISSQGLPLLQSLPVIGKLFGSDNYRKQLTELMIFVTPKVKKQ